MDDKAEAEPKTVLAKYYTNTCKVHVLNFNLITLTLLLVLGDKELGRSWRICYHCSGGSRIFPGGAPTPKVGVLIYYFCRKLHENERIWTPGGGRASLAPPLDPPMHCNENLAEEDNKSR